MVGIDFAALRERTRASFYGAAAAAAPHEERASVPQKLHWVWVGDKRLGEDSLSNIFETARRAPGYAKTIWTNDPKLIHDALQHGGGRISTQIDLDSALRRLGIKIRSISELLERPMPGFSSREMRQLEGLIERDISAPLANRASASDILRLIALHREGGVYLDVDFMPPGSEPTETQRLATPTRAELFARTKDLIRSQSSTDCSLGRVPAKRFGFSASMIPGLGFNNSMLAAVPGERRADSITGRALTTILRHEKMPLTQRSAEAELVLSPQLPFASKVMLPVVVAAKRATLRRVYTERARTAFPETTNGANLHMPSFVHFLRSAKVGARELVLLAGLAEGKISGDRYVDASIANRASLLMSTKNRSASCFAPSKRTDVPDAGLPLTWELKRLRPHRQAQINNIRFLRDHRPAASNVMTQNMTGPLLVANAIMTHEPFLEALRADMPRNGTLAAMSAFGRLFSEAILDAPFFGRLPPCDNPSLKALEEIDYAHDSPV